MRLLLRSSIALLPLLAACHSGKPAGNGLDAMDNQLLNGAVVAENASNASLASAIRVDPARTGRHEAGDRAATTSLGQMADRQRHGRSAMPAVTEDGEGSAVGGGSGCLAGLVYGNSWAGKLPADLPLHPQARLTEAAGHDGACQARVVSFTVPGDRGQVLGWYRDKADAAGYHTGRDDKDGDWILVADKGGSAAYIIIGPVAGGATPVDYVYTHQG